VSERRSQRVTPRTPARWRQSPRRSGKSRCVSLPARATTSTCYPLPSIDRVRAQAAENSGCSSSQRVEAAVGHQRVEAAVGPQRVEATVGPQRVDATGYIRSKSGRPLAHDKEKAKVSTVRTHICCKQISNNPANQPLTSGRGAMHLVRSLKATNRPYP
jgi:hypothetical protein